MSHLANTGDQGWPELLPPDRDPRSEPLEPPDAIDDPDDDLFAGWEPRPRVNRLTAVLAACVLVVAGFAVGAVVAKRSSSSSPAAATTGAAGRFGGTGAAGGREGFGGFAGGAGGFGAGGGGGGAGFGGAGTGAGAGTGSGAGTGAGTAAGAATGTPVVVGTVTAIGKNQITVKNFAGTSVVVHIPAGTPVTTPGLGGLKQGQTVSVEGKRASGGSVTATAVVSRS